MYLILTPLADGGRLLVGQSETARDLVARWDAAQQRYGELIVQEASSAVAVDLAELKRRAEAELND